MHRSNWQSRILICGSGACSHALAGIFSRQSDVAVTILTKDSDKVRLWQHNRKVGPLRLSVAIGSDQRELTAGEIICTDDPARAARDCDMVIFAIPAFTHASYFQLLAPYLPAGCTIVGLPGQNGFEWEARTLLGDRLRRLILLDFDSYPWVCRLTNFGQHVSITGKKQHLVGAIQGNLSRARLTDPLGYLQKILGEYPRLEVSGHMLAITLMAVNAYSHPPIMYGRWHNWDGVPLDEPAYFYRDIDTATGELLTACSGEVVACAKRIMALRPGLDLERVIPMYQWDMDRYGNVITDTTNQTTLLRTNPFYQNIQHPMIQTSRGQYVPDFGHRFLSEDVPFGLAVIRGISEIINLPTPNLDKVLLWCQAKLARQYLVDGRIAGRDVAETRCPQKYGIHTLSALLDASSTDESWRQCSRVG